jgi:hypothetical protein
MPEPLKGTKLNSNPIDDSRVADVGELTQIYSDDDKTYLSYLQERLQNAKLQKEQQYPEFKGKTYYQYYEENEKIANTFLEPTKNSDDVQVSAGTVEQKLDSLLSHINNLNLSPEVFAFDKDNNQVVALATALQDIIYDTEIRDGGDGAGDEEKKLLRQRELLKQGTVFVQEEWLRKFETKKKLHKEFDGKFKQDADFYTKELQLVFEGPSRTLLYGPNVFLGDITKFYMDEQPFAFVVIRDNHSNVKTKYAGFDNFKYVRPGAFVAADDSGLANGGRTIFDNKWRLTELQKDQDEIILYQDQANDEFQIIINGVLMLPIGFPLSAVTPMGKYNITKQVYRVINDKFAYGAAFVSAGSVKEISKLVDEMLKLFVLKTRKSFTPAYVNTSGRVIDRKVLSPGRISMGIEPGSLVPIAGNEVQGITAGEASFLTKMQDLIDKSTVSDQFTGQQGPAGTTATEINALQQQARLTLGLTVAACALLEKKLAYLRLYNILQNWFEPIGNQVKQIGEARKLVGTYRRVTRTNVNVAGQGPGERTIVLQEGELPDAEVIREYERMEERTKGMPIRKIFINPVELKTASIIWYIVVNSKERESSPFFKMVFKEMLSDMLTLMQFGSVPNKDGLEEEFAKIWGKPRNKLFASQGQNLAGVSGAGDGAPVPSPIQPSGRPNQTGAMPPGGLTGAGVGQ